MVAPRVAPRVAYMGNNRWCVLVANEKEVVDRVVCETTTFEYASLIASLLIRHWDELLTAEGRC